MQGLNRRWATQLGAATVLTAFALLGSGCFESTPSAEDKDASARAKGVAGLIAGQPAKTMDYSPTRATINRWIETWDEPGKLAYVYLQNAAGDLIGYYVFEGLPVSYCASITKPQKVVDTGADSAVVVQEPGVDGAWYGGGGACQEFYGYDAGTKTYMEFGTGFGINPLIYSRPLPRQDVKALGFTTIEEAKKLG